ncbi:BZ3500_MvSof-1268-A1-R1_Chr6-2g08596 [Microbotryum saponariae]|uniref:BZ3500_MvSof-1268-A1-R1_Chr6-2g08596 protein n=1 Tax=Microbotryum saponariae TaxID=289078 RepID=A0A2X0MM14_9BASI|nr:BZ3500_MvSof-1268-A1-R1_Chr6-2g08596 [Microbotryum saponariae]SDA07868.1 BZ3501_MvSof-1269-A2-R1_Chr6-1g08305 [Microbotryum saponariae]
MEPVAYVDSPFARYLEEAGIDEHTRIESLPALAIGEPNVFDICALNHADVDSPPDLLKSRGSPSTPRRSRSRQDNGDECIKFALSTSSLLTPRLEDALNSYPSPSHQILSVTECSARAATVHWQIGESPRTLGIEDAVRRLWQRLDFTVRIILSSMPLLALPVSAFRDLPAQTSVETAYTMVDMTRLFDRLIAASQEFDRHTAQVLRSLRSAKPFSPGSQRSPPSTKRMRVLNPLHPWLAQPSGLASMHSRMLMLMQEMAHEYRSASWDPLFCALGAVVISDATGGSKTAAEPNLRDGVFGGIHRANSIARGAGGGAGKHRARPSVGAEGVFGIGTAGRGESPEAVKIGGRRSLSPRRRPLSWSLEYTVPTSGLSGTIPLPFDNTSVDGYETNSEETVPDKLQSAFESVHGARRLWLLNLTAIIGLPSTRLNRLASHVGSMAMTVRRKLDQLEGLQIVDKRRMLSASSANADLLPPWNGHNFAPPPPQSPAAVSLTDLEGCHAALCELLRGMEVQMAATVDEARKRLNEESISSPAALFTRHDSVRQTLDMLRRNYDESRLILRRIEPDAKVGRPPLTALCARANLPAAVAEDVSAEVHAAVLSASSSFVELGEGSELFETSPSHAVDAADREVEQIFEANVPASPMPLRSTRAREERIRAKRDQRVSDLLKSPISSEIRLIGELKGVLEARRKPLKACDDV